MTAKCAVFFNLLLTCYSLLWSSRMGLFFILLRFKINPCKTIRSKVFKNGPGKIFAFKKSEVIWSASAGHISRPHPIWKESWLFKTEEFDNVVANLRSHIQSNLAHFYTIPSQTQTLSPTIPFFNHLFQLNKNSPQFYQP